MKSQEPDLRSGSSPLWSDGEFSCTIAAVTFRIYPDMYRFFPAFALCAVLSFAQAPAPNRPGIATADDSVVFNSKVTLVPVPVVVRDKKGKVVTRFDRRIFGFSTTAGYRSSRSFPLRGRAVPRLYALPHRSRKARSPGHPPPRMLPS